MKTGKYIIALLMALIIGTPNMVGQKATRSGSREKREQTTVKKAHTRPTTSQKARTVQPDRQVKRTQVQKQQVTRQRTTQPTRQKIDQPTRQKIDQPTRQKINQPTRQKINQPSRQKTTQQVQRSRSQQVEHQRSDRTDYQNNRTAQRGEIQKRQVAHSQRPASVSTTHNPKSQYRTADNKVYSKRNKYSDKRYYSGHHYHHVYPNRRVKLHYHHDTYVHNYHVLYYPAYTDIFWTRNMYRDYHRWYPNYRWRYDYGYRIQTISVFDAKYNLGEVAMVYGRVYATWHNRETDDFLLFFGGDYPYQQFTVVLPGHIARKFSWRPERFFLGEHLTITGLITTFDGNPEIIVKNKRQLGIY